MLVRLKNRHINIDFREDEQSGQLRNSGDGGDLFDMCIVLTAVEEQFRFDFIDGFVDEIHVGFCMD